MKIREIKEFLGINILRSTIIISMVFLLLFLLLIFIKGFSVLSLDFLLKAPKNGMTEGGIFPAIIGTLYLTILSVIIAFPLGVLSAIFLVEFGKPKWFINIIRIAINTLAGVPSIVYGLFGLAVFVTLFNLVKLLGKEVSWLKLKSIVLRFFNEFHGGDIGDFVFGGSDDDGAGGVSGDV